MNESPLRILTYHRVRDAHAGDLGSSVVSATPGSFAREMQHLAAHYRVVSAEDVLDAVQRRRPLPPRAVLLTFDDAYEDFAEHAWPVLRRHNLPATVFVPTAFPDRPDRVFWWDLLAHFVAETSRSWVEVPGLGVLSLHGTPARAASLRRLQQHLKTVPHGEVELVVRYLQCQFHDVRPARSAVLSWTALEELARDGVTLAPHTRTHPALTQLPPEQVRAELRGSREDLQQHVGRVPPMFAYPFGLHDDAVVQAVRDEGFALAVTTLPGQNLLSRIDPLRLQRTNVGLRTSAYLFPLRLLGAFAAVDQVRYRLRGESPAPALVRGTM